MKRWLTQIYLLLAVLLPALALAQFNFTTNNDALTITEYIGSSETVVIPGTTNGYPVTNIGMNAFASNGIVASVTIPDSVNNIGEQAFESCSNLVSVTIGNSVTNIGMGAFVFCRLLTNVTIPNSVISIGLGAFDDCSSMTSVTIPNNVISIGQGAFSGCYFLTNVKIGNGVTSIGANAFQVCTNVAYITIGNNVANIGSYGFAFCDNLKGLYFKGDAPTLANNSTVFTGDNNATVYYLPGTTGWGSTFGGLPVVLWNPRAQTGDGGFGVQNNQFGFNISGSSNLVVVVEAATNMAGSNWISVGTNTLNTFVGTNGTSYFSDPQWNNYPRRYYRLRSL